MKIVSLAFCSSSVRLYGLYELARLVFIASRGIKPTELVPRKFGIKNFVNGLYALRAGSVNIIRSEKWKLLSGAGKERSSGAQIHSYRLLRHTVGLS